MPKNLDIFTTLYKELNTFYVDETKKLKNYIINIIKNNHKDDKKVAEVIALVKENGGLEYAKKRMQEYHNTALDLLNPFGDNKAKQSLILLLDYVVNRKK